jgi:hypothetical protein
MEAGRTVGADEQDVDLDNVLGMALEQSHLLHPGSVADLAAAAGEVIGAHEYVVHLVDYEQRTLVPLVPPGHEPAEIEGTVAGRSFSTGEVVEVPHDGGRRVWVPMIDGAERLGVVGFTVEELDETLERRAVRLASLITQFIVTKSQYTDHYALAARRREMSVAAEMQWRLLPPLTCTTRQFALSALVEPAYDIGGDVFDYALNDDVAHVMIADAVGHGLEAVWPASLALGSFRRSRRRGLDLPETYAAVSRQIMDQFDDGTFVTSVILQFDTNNGRLRWINAGHPPPLLIREGRVSDTLQCRPSLPLGIGESPVEIADVTLQPWDRVLFFTDGVIEGRRKGADPFGVERLADAVSRETLAGNGPAETMRRLAKAVLDHQEHELRDDFTLLVIEYRDERAIGDLPTTVARIPQQRSV